MTMTPHWLFFIAEPTVLITAVALNAVLLYRWWVLKARWRLAAFYAVIVITATGALLLNMQNAYRAGMIAGINAVAGCDENSPKEVPYHDGMTLCPGQTAIMAIPLPAPPTPAGEKRL